MIRVPAVVLAACCVTFAAVHLPALAEADDAATKAVRVGIIGVDNYQCVAFTQLFQKPPEDNPDLRGIEVVAAWPGGSPDVAESVKGLPQWRERLSKMGVKIEDSIDAVLDQVDAVLVMSLDGRTHLELATAALKAGKPVYVGRPLAATLEDVVAIFEVARREGTPLFSCSQHRYSPGFIAMRNHPEAGSVVGCDVYGGLETEPHHAGYFWHPHSFETLYTIMGPGAKTVTRTESKTADLITGTWKDGRIGTCRLAREGAVKYSALVYGDRGIVPAGMYGYEAPVKGVVPKGRYKGYEGVATEIAKFFKTGKLPVQPEETIELFAFIEAAHESGRRGGAAVNVDDVLEKARQAVAKRK